MTLKGVLRHALLKAVDASEVEVPLEEDDPFLAGLF
jgi:hypothetical protein